MNALVLLVLAILLAGMAGCSRPGEVPARCGVDVPCPPGPFGRSPLVTGPHRNAPPEHCLCRPMYELVRARP